MSTVERELESFTHYAKQQIGKRAGEISIEELFEQWRAENPSNDQYMQNIAAVRESIEDFKNGERGTIAGEHSAELRRILQTGHE